jgi:hypothetical protein
MVREYQKYHANLHLDENEQLDFDVKKTIMVFPGLTRAFKHKNDALDYLKHAQVHDQHNYDGLAKVCFRINIFFRGHNRAMDVKKFMLLNHDNDAVPECDGLFQRLVVQVEDFKSTQCCGKDSIDLVWVDSHLKLHPDKPLLSVDAF